MHTYTYRHTHTHIYIYIYIYIYIPVHVASVRYVQDEDCNIRLHETLST